VTPLSGQPVSGTLLSISDFYVTLKDAKGTRHTFARDCDVPEVVVTDPIQGHIDLITKLTDRDMHNLTAYLVTLK
jgi:cytochrome c oxidase cbb3-type subunit 3